MKHKAITTAKQLVAAVWLAMLAVGIVSAVSCSAGGAAPVDNADAGITAPLAALPSVAELEKAAASYPISAFTMGADAILHSDDAELTPLGELILRNDAQGNIEFAVYQLPCGGQIPLQLHIAGHLLSCHVVLANFATGSWEYIDHNWFSWNSLELAEWQPYVSSSNCVYLAVVLGGVETKWGEYARVNSLGLVQLGALGPEVLATVRDAEALAIVADMLATRRELFGGLYPEFADQLLEVGELPQGSYLEIINPAGYSYDAFVVYPLLDGTTGIWHLDQSGIIAQEAPSELVPLDVLCVKHLEDIHQAQTAYYGFIGNYAGLNELEDGNFIRDLYSRTADYPPDSPYNELHGIVLAREPADGGQSYSCALQSPTGSVFEVDQTGVITQTAGQ